MHRFQGYIRCGRGPAVMALVAFAGLVLAAATATVRAQSFGASPTSMPSAWPTTSPAVVPQPLFQHSPTTAPTTLPTTLPAATAVDGPPAPRKINRSREVPATQGTTNQNNADANGTGQPPSFDAGRVGGALALVIALILFLKWGSKKVFAMPNAGGANGLMQVVSRTALAPRQQLLMVRVGRRLMIVGDSGGRLSSLGEIGDPNEVATLLGQAQAKHDERAKSVPFTSLLGRLAQRTKRRQPDADWDELDATPSFSADNRSERDELLTGLHDQDERDGVMAIGGDLPHSKYVDPIDDDDLPARDTADAEAQAAVEAARFDIQALRAKLREVTGRLTEPPVEDDDASKPFKKQTDRDREDEAGAA